MNIPRVRIKEIMAQTTYVEVDDKLLTQWMKDEKESPCLFRRGRVSHKSDCLVSECEKYFAEDEFVIFGEKSDKLKPENKRKLIKAARQMFKEDFGE